MAELLAAIVSFPAVVPTVLLGVALLYWMLVLFGALDIDLFSADGAADGLLDGAAEGATHGLLDGAADGAVDGVLHGAADGVADGALDGVADGALDGAADGALDGVADGAADGAADGLVHVDPSAGADGAIEAAHGSVVASLLSLANFRSVPVTVVFSVLVVFTWLLCVLTVGVLGLPGWLLGSGILAGSFVVALPPTAVVIRPLARFFVVHGAKSHKEMVGRVCQITTGSVGEKFGQARLVADDLDLIVQVRSDSEGSLGRGDRALILAWDAKREAFLVEPYDKLLTGGKED